MADESVDLKGLDKSREERIADYDAWIVRNRALGKVGHEAWGRWVAGKYQVTGKVPTDPLLASVDTSVSSAVDTPEIVDKVASETVDTSTPVDRKSYQREWARKQRELMRKRREEKP